MKQFFFLLLCITMSSTVLLSQNEALGQFIDQHKSEPNFSYAFLSKDLFEVATQSSIKQEDWKGLHQVVKNMGSLRILAADSILNSITLYKEARSLVSSTEYDELLTVKDGSENVRIWAKSEEAIVTELILLVGTPSEFVLVCFAGNLELGNLSELSKLFEAGKVEQLARTSAQVSIDFNCSPNPSNGTFALTYTDPEDMPNTLSVIDQSGRLVSSLSLSGESRQSVTLQGLPTGVYWLQLVTQKGKIGVKQIQIAKD